MIDIHSHVLPFVDDGSRTLEASLSMIKIACESGVTDLFLTPHYMKTRNYLSTYEDNLSVFLNFQRQVKIAGYDIRLHLGNEIYYTIDTMRQLQKKTVIPMGTSNKVLIEFSLSGQEEDIVEAIHNLKASGYVPIIAHPERYPYLKSVTDYGLMKKMGALIQLNAPSIVGKYGQTIQKMAMRLIKLDFVDFVGSDVHEFRANDLKAAYDTVRDKFGNGTADKLFSNHSLLG
jgi:protein-tyrosine phosphatase